MVDGIVPRQDQLADGHHRITVIDEIFQDPRQRLRSMERGVMEQHNAARLHLGGDPLIDGIRVIVLPVQTVPIGNDLKPLRRKELRVWRLCALTEKLTCKWGVWRVVQARERSKSRGCARGWGG